MKKIVISLFFAIILLGCTPSPDSIDLEITVESRNFRENPANVISNVEVYNITASKGEEFNPPYMFFKVKKIIDKTHVKLSFDLDNLVVEGEDLFKESTQNPIIITTEPTCFVTRTLDSGEEFCLRVISET